MFTNALQYKVFLESIPFKYFITISFPDYLDTPIQKTQVKRFLKRLHRKFFNNSTSKYFSGFIVFERGLRGDETIKSNHAHILLEEHEVFTRKSHIDIRKVTKGILRGLSIREEAVDVQDYYRKNLEAYFIKSIYSTDDLKMFKLDQIF